MAYTKNTWVDQAGQVRYQQTTDQDDLLILTPNYEQVTQLGTPVNAANMNHIEDGILGCYTDLVNKSGDTMTGNLTIARDDETNAITLRDTNLTKGTTPSANNYQGISFRDKDNAAVGLINLTHATSGANQLSIRTYKPQSGSNDYIEIVLTYDANGNPFFNVPEPAITANTSNAATTQWVRNFAKTSGNNYMSSFSRDVNGYYKFTNGLIIQWGKNTGSSATATITLPIAFTSTNYIVTIQDYGDSGSSISNNKIITSETTTTSFQYRTSSSTNDQISWIAIGY